MTPLAPAHGRAPALARPSRPAAAPRPPRRARLGVAAAAQQQAGDGAAAAAAASADPQQQQQQQQQQQAGAQAPGPEGEKGARSRSSSWGAVESGGGRGGGADYLYELGKSDYNTNVDAGQNVAHIDYLFTGNTLGHKTDIADGSLRGYEFRTFENIQGDYFIAPRFLEKVAVHVVKTYLVDSGALDPAVRVPLILGIWGPKGCGKTFQLELAFKKLGVEAVVMSAGELESDIAGKPGRLIRERYRKASNMGKVRGRLTALVINDIDAGLGHFANTQITVNNQIVVGTVRGAGALCKHPDHGQQPDRGGNGEGGWWKGARERFGGRGCGVLRVGGLEGVWGAEGFLLFGSLGLGLRGAHGSPPNDTGKPLKPALDPNRHPPPKPPPTPSPPS